MIFLPYFLMTPLLSSVANYWVDGRATGAAQVQMTNSSGMNMDNPAGVRLTLGVGTSAAQRAIKSSG
jgi:hypothetical protein